MNYDKLLIDIYTNGALEPIIALFLSAKLLRDMAGKICLFEIEPQYIRDVYIDPELEEKNASFLCRLKKLNSPLERNCLEAANIKTIGDLVSKTEQEMLKYRNFGKNLWKKSFRN